MAKVVSKAQAGLVGIIAGGGRPTKCKVKVKGRCAPGLSAAEAKDMLRGVKVKALPKRKR